MTVLAELRSSNALATRPKWLLAAVCAVGLLGPGLSAQDNEDCLECHAVEGLSFERDGRKVTLEIDPDRFDESVHAGMDCIMCHLDLDGVEKYPHAKDLERVDCTDCHDDDNGPVATYRASTHGLRAADGDALAPLCQDCHGDHYVLRLSDADSSISPFNIAGMCTQCHVEGQGIQRSYDLPGEQALERYPEHIHAAGLAKLGLSVTAVCTSCHTGHDVRPATDPRSTLHRDNLAATCMQCHGKLQEVHGEVIARELWETDGAVPLCVDCHSPHEDRHVFYDTKLADADCMRCHADPIVAEADGRSLVVDAAEHKGSVHGRSGVSCAKCHSGVTPSEERPCDSITASVNCAVCHAAEVEAYDTGQHGRLHAAGDPNAPDCTDCHGAHGILEHAPPPGADASLRERLRASPTFARNVPALCARCHEEGAPAARRNLGPEDQIVEHYAMSIHGKGLLESGLTVTAVCTDCHTAHRELPASDPESTVHPDQISGTCGTCHDGIYDQFERSIHSRAGNPDYVQLRGMPALPKCNDCHSSHTMARTDLPDFQFGIMQQCGHCHEEITETYFDTYHGKASELGDAAKAKCYDCHGAHDILPVDMPASHLHKDHIVGTCGKCHEGSHAEFATYLTHANHHDPDKYPALYYAFVGMTTLLVSTFAFFGLHTLAWLPRSWKRRKEHHAELGSAKNTKQFQRFTPFQRALHLTMILSFFGLAITGMMLKFSYAGWAQGLSRLVGGAAVAGFIHRICAIATFGYMGLHLWDVWRRFRRSGSTAREFLLGPNSLVPRWSDVTEFFATVRWFFGRGPAPRYGRWTYWEKFDYFAVFWGVGIIGVSGLFLWFPELVTHAFPGWSINVATIIHSDEALLATGFIFTIHFFNTHFRPEKFPLDPVMFTGRMRLKELQLERPAQYEALKASGELEKHLVDPAPPAFARVAMVFGFTALFVGVTLVVLIVYTLLFGGR